MQKNVFTIIIILVIIIFGFIIGPQLIGLVYFFLQDSSYSITPGYDRSISRNFKTDNESFTLEKTEQFSFQSALKTKNTIQTGHYIELNYFNNQTLHDLDQWGIESGKSGDIELKYDAFAYSQITKVDQSTNEITILLNNRSDTISIQNYNTIYLNKSNDFELVTGFSQFSVSTSNVSYVIEQDIKVNALFGRGDAFYFNFNQIVFFNSFFSMTLMITSSSLAVP